MTQKIQVVPVNSNKDARVETGAVEFVYNDGEREWPGMFIRGDNAFALAMEIAQLRELIKHQPQIHIPRLCNLQTTIMNDVRLKNVSE